MRLDTETKEAHNIDQEEEDEEEYSEEYADEEEDEDALPPLRLNLFAVAAPAITNYPSPIVEEDAE